jgi:UDP-3-O-[3-hydroxymyristoyl] glucosamine N-acyltransferase
MAQTSQLGNYGIQILAGSHIGANAHVANGCLINHHAIVEHDSSLGAFSHLAPNAVMLGGVKVGGSCLVGANATILPSVEITDGCTIGASAIVCHSITQAGIYKGVI